MLCAAVNATVAWRRVRYIGLHLLITSSWACDILYCAMQCACALNFERVWQRDLRRRTMSYIDYYRWLGGFPDVIIDIILILFEFNDQRASAHIAIDDWPTYISVFLMDCLLGIVWKLSFPFCLLYTLLNKFPRKFTSNHELSLFVPIMSISVGCFLDLIEAHATLFKVLFKWLQSGADTEYSSWLK